MRILLVEDEKRMSSFIERGLREEHFALDAASNAQRAYELAQMNSYDLIILDIMLPGEDGFSICRKLRSQKISSPILMLTARNSVRDKVTGLNAGADDYLGKPFDFEEFLARVQALLRRTRKDKTTTLQVADLVLDQVTHRVTRSGKEINLTSKEYALLEYMMVHKHQVITRTMISEHVWDESFDTFTNVIDVYVNYLRNKIDKDFSPALIHTIRGTGYVLKETP